MEVLRTIWQTWRWRGVGALIAASNLTLIAVFAPRGGNSLAWTALLVASSPLSVVALLYFVEKVHRQRGERDRKLQGVRELGKRLAIYDRETGLYAYWYFSLRLEEELARSGRYGESFGLLLVEANQGRLGRDEESALFRSMTALFRTSDLVAHLGNLRFVALLIGTDAEGGQIVAERVRTQANKSELTVGIAMYPEDGDDAASLMRSAGAPGNVIDEALTGSAGVIGGRQTLLQKGSGGAKAKASHP